MLKHGILDINFYLKVVDDKIKIFWIKIYLL